MCKSSKFLNLRNLSQSLELMHTDFNPNDLAVIHSQEVEMARSIIIITISLLCKWYMCIWQMYFDLKLSSSIYGDEKKYRSKLLVRIKYRKLLSVWQVQLRKLLFIIFIIKRIWSRRHFFLLGNINVPLDTPQVHSSFEVQFWIDA